MQLRKDIRAPGNNGTLGFSFEITVRIEVHPAGGPRFSCDVFSNDYALFVVEKRQFKTIQDFEDKVVSYVLSYADKWMHVETGMFNDNATQALAKEFRNFYYYDIVNWINEDN